MRCLVAPASIIFLGEVVIEMLDEQPSADLTEFAVAVMHLSLIHISLPP